MSEYKEIKKEKEDKDKKTEIDPARSEESWRSPTPVSAETAPGETENRIQTDQADPAVLLTLVSAFVLLYYNRFFTISTLR